MHALCYYYADSGCTNAARSAATHPKTVAHYTRYRSRKRERRVRIYAHALPRFDDGQRVYIHART